MKGILGLIVCLTLNFNMYSAECESPVTKERFNTLLESVEAQKHDQQKYQLIVAYSKRECLTVEQMSKFVDQISEHKMKVSVVQATYMHLFDSENVDNLTIGFTEHEKLVVKKTTSK